MTTNFFGIIHITPCRESIFTIKWIKMFVRVRNCVTTSATLPGMADTGIMKLI